MGVYTKAVKGEGLWIIKKQALILRRVTGPWN